MICDKDFFLNREDTKDTKVREEIEITSEGEVVDYFRNLAEETDILYQTLINFYLRDFVRSQRKLSLE